MVYILPVALNIKSDEADKLARELARRRRKPITTVVVDALRAELEREKRRERAPGLAERLMVLGDEYSRLPVFDERSEDEILGFNEMTN
jgi:antitoxin VapB